MHYYNSWRFKIRISMYEHISIYISSKLSKKIYIYIIVKNLRVLGRFEFKTDTKWVK